MENDVFVYRHSCIHDGKYHVCFGVGTFQTAKFNLSNRSDLHKELYHKMDVCIIKESLSRGDAIDLANSLIRQYRSEPDTVCLNRRLITKPTVIDYSTLGRFVEYSEEIPSGLLWKAHEQKHLIGKQAGCKSIADGYYRIQINKVMYLNHRVIYCICNKETIDGFLQIDHIDRNRGNNKSSNLRKVTQKKT